MDKKDLNNVIPFPGPKTRSEQSEAPKTSKPRAPKKKAISDNKKVLISSSLLSILFIVTMANRSLMRTPEDNIRWTSHEQFVEGSRSIASVEATQFTRNNDWEKEIAQELSQEVGRKPSSLSTTASEEQQFRYGFLGSAYRVQYNLNGKVEEIEYDRTLTPRMSHEPKYLSAAEILEGRYKRFLPWTFATWSTDKKNVEGAIIEEISLSDREGKRIGIIMFKSDSHGRFLSMKAQSI